MTAKPGSGAESDSSGATIGTAGPRDADRLLEFWKRAAKGVSVTDDPAGVQRLLAHPTTSVLIAEADGELVGTLIASWDGWRAHLYRLAVSPAHRRQGFATALLAVAQERLTDMGARRLDAMVLNDNPEAHLAWEASGFHAQPQWRRWIKPVQDDPQSR